MGENNIPTALNGCGVESNVRFEFMTSTKNTIAIYKGIAERPYENQYVIIQTEQATSSKRQNILLSISNV